MRVIYHPEAEEELLQAAQFYQGQLPGLGARFLHAADSAVDLIRNAPERWRIVEADVRAYVMQVFPYAIYYRLLPEHVRILAFKHHSRHPDYWRHRIFD